MEQKGRAEERGLFVCGAMCALVFRGPGAGRVGAGDRDRTGDIQLGKLTIPSAHFLISFRLSYLPRKRFILIDMLDLHASHTVSSFAYTVPGFVRFWTVWTVWNFADCPEV
jgi:hypothetical protein